MEPGVNGQSNFPISHEGMGRIYGDKPLDSHLVEDYDGLVDIPIMDDIPKAKSKNFKANISKAMAAVGQFLSSSKTKLESTTQSVFSRLKNNLKNNFAVKFVKKIAAVFGFVNIVAKEAASEKFGELNAKKNVKESFKFNDVPILKRREDLINSGDFQKLQNRIKTEDSEPISTTEKAMAIAGFYTKKPELEQTDKRLREFLSQYVIGSNPDDMGMKTLSQEAGCITKKTIEEKNWDEDNYEKVLIPKFDIEINDKSKVVTVTRKVTEMYIHKIKNRPDEFI
ncbi:MAG: hypothetical protein VX777_10090 [Chlamydiota bacterium]|nr:hypothetical protein [Chlamydiota bacterium]